MRREPRVRYRFGQFFIEPAKTKSDSIKLNQTNEGIQQVDQEDINTSVSTFGRNNYLFLRTSAF